jgi:hypothetical protein
VAFGNGALVGDEFGQDELLKSYCKGTGLNHDFDLSDIFKSGV